MKHRIVHTVQKYLLNPPIKLALVAGLPLPGYAMLETKGRKTGARAPTLAGESVAEQCREREGGAPFRDATPLYSN
jgi:hypothetical protein